MKNFFLAIWNFIKKVTPFCSICGAFLFLLSTQITIDKDIQSLTLQMQEIELNQASEYKVILTVDLALAKEDTFFAQQLDQIKADEQKQNGALVKTIYAVDKKADARSNEIINGVNGLVKDVSYALQKPSYEYLKNITVRIEAKEVIADADGHHHGWLGTGAILAITKDYTYILTNRHVVAQFGDGTHNYYVKYEDNKYPFDVLKISKNEAVDLALVRIKGSIPGKVAVIGFADSKPQDPIFSVGENLGRLSIYAEGTVSGFDATSNDELVVGMPSAPGDSGSPIINKDGKLIGLLYAGSIIDQEGIRMMDTTHGLCVPIKSILLFLAGNVE
jgi:S1-C subfamily serine protease